MQFITRAAEPFKRIFEPSETKRAQVSHVKETFKHMPRETRVYLQESGRKIAVKCMQNKRQERKLPMQYLRAPLHRAERTTSSMHAHKSALEYSICLPIINLINSIKLVVNYH